MVTNGEQTIDNKLFSDVIKQNIQDVTSPFKSPDNTISPIDNVTCKN